MRGTWNIAGQRVLDLVPLAERVPAAAEQSNDIATVVAFGFVALLLWAIGYAIACWWFPFGRCRRCRGAGYIADKSEKHFRLCRKCLGNRPLRLGRRVFNYLHHQRKAAS